MKLEMLQSGDMSRWCEPLKTSQYNVLLMGSLRLMALSINVDDNYISNYVRHAVVGGNSSLINKNSLFMRLMSVGSC